MTTAIPTTATPREYAVIADIVLIDADHALADAAVLVRSGIIAAVGRRQDIVTANLPRLHLRSSILMPGLVNAHTHLGLSGLGDARPSRPDFGAWIMAMASTVRSLTPARYRSALHRGVRELIATGTTAAGDIVPLGARAIASESPLAGVRFIELLGMNRGYHDFQIGPLHPDEGLAPHAPYSTSESIYRGAADLARQSATRLALHIAESTEEDTFVRRGLGPFADFLRSLGRLPDDWRAPATSPIRYLEQLGALSANSLLIHASFANVADRTLIQRSGATVVTCPRSNLLLTGQTTDVPALLRLGVPVALGTDSLASAPSLSLLDELRSFCAVHPSVTSDDAVRIATINGAVALGLNAGALHVGRRADLTAFALAGSDRQPSEHVLRAERARFVAIGGNVVRGRKPRSN